MKSRVSNLSLLLLWLLVPAGAQPLDPARWQVQLDSQRVPPGASVLGRLIVQLEGSWHLYSPTTPKGGPIPTTIELSQHPALSGYKLYQPPPTTAFDPSFQMNTETYARQVVFLVEIGVSKEATPGPVEITVHTRYQLCDEKQCLPPRRKTVSATLTIDPAAPQPNIVIPSDYQLVTEKQFGSPAALPTGTGTAAFSTGAQCQNPNVATQGWIPFLLIAFGFGLAAVFTPCVFPMIPITVSYFLKQKAAARFEAFSQAAAFGLGIIALFSGLGFLVTLILGPFGMVQLGSNPWVNGFIALVFFVFGLSLLGAFELNLPSSWLTRLDRASQRGGMLGTLLMGLTFSLTAFACVGPFVGTLLAASIQSGGTRPLIGMVAFATGLALPFFLLALFPALLERMPKSGGWLPRVKVVLGLVIFAAMFKYLSNVDQVMQWGVLTRERFLAAWIVLFGIAGLYLLGLVRLPGVDPNAPLGVSRLLVAVAFLGFAISLIPGLLGGRLGELEAYIPPPASQTGLLIGSASTEPLPWMKNQYEEALAKARSEGKLVFVAFTGYACTNCHWMKANMFTRPEIAQELRRYVLVELYTDGVDAASERNQQLQQKLFATVAIPYYAILDGEGRVLASFAGLTRDAAQFLAFLRSPQPTLTQANPQTLNDQS